MHEPEYEDEEDSYETTWLERFDEKLWTFPRLTGEPCSFCVGIRAWILIAWITSNIWLISLILALTAGS